MVFQYLAFLWGHLCPSFAPPMCLLQGEACPRGAATCGSAKASGSLWQPGCSRAAWTAARHPPAAPITGPSPGHGGSAAGGGQGGLGLRGSLLVASPSSAGTWASFPRPGPLPCPAPALSGGITVCTLVSTELHNSLSAKALESSAVAILAAPLLRQETRLKEQREGGRLNSC